MLTAIINHFSEDIQKYIKPSDDDDDDSLLIKYKKAIHVLQFMKWVLLKNFSFCKKKESFTGFEKNEERIFSSLKKDDKVAVLQFMTLIVSHRLSENYTKYDVCSSPLDKREEEAFFLFENLIEQHESGETPRNEVLWYFVRNYQFITKVEILKNFDGRLWTNNYLNIAIDYQMNNLVVILVYLKANLKIRFNNNPSRKESIMNYVYDNENFILAKMLEDYIEEW